LGDQGGTPKYLERGRKGPNPHAPKLSIGNQQRQEVLLGRGRLVLKKLREWWREERDRGGKGVGWRRRQGEDGAGVGGQRAGWVGEQEAVKSL